MWFFGQTRAPVISAQRDKSFRSDVCFSMRPILVTQKTLKRVNTGNQPQRKPSVYYSRCACGRCSTASELFVIAQTLRNSGTPTNTPVCRIDHAKQQSQGPG